MKVATGAKRVREEEKFCCLVIHLVEVCIDTSTRLETSPPDVVSRDKYRKSYERECISWFMGTSDVLKVLKIARAVGECNLGIFKTSRVTINHEMHEQVHMIFYLLYSRQNYSIALLSAIFL